MGLKGGFPQPVLSRLEPANTPLGAQLRDPAARLPVFKANVRLLGMGMPAGVDVQGRWALHGFLGALGGCATQGNKRGADGEACMGT